MTTKYDTNETMKLIGRQHVMSLIAVDAPAAPDFKAVLEANKHEAELFSLGVDFFTLGLMYGVKAERAKRAHTEITTLT